MNDLINIELTKGQYSLIGVEDADLSSYKWYYAHGYARHGKWINGRLVKFLLHRVIVERMIDRALVTGEVVDHINGIKTDNRRSNLRIATPHQNSLNQLKPKNNTSGFKGVVALRGKWQAQVKFNRQNVYAGVYDTAIEAARAYDAKCLELFGEYSKLNFPRPAERYDAWVIEFALVTDVTP